MSTRTQRLFVFALCGAGLVYASPETYDTYLTRSANLINTWRYPEAIAAAKEALRLNPDSAIAWNNIAVAEMLQHHPQDALRNIQEALRLSPGFQLAQNNLAWIQKEQPAGTSVGWSAGTPEYFLDLSLWQFQGGRYQLCIDAAREALKLKPDMAEAWNNIAVAYEGMKMYDQAIDSAQKAIALKPDFELAKNNLNAALGKKSARVQ